MAFALTSIMAFGQSSVLDNTNNWTSIENIDLYSGQHFEDTISITINQRSVTLKNDDRVMTFGIENISGTWSDLDSEGQLFFDIPIRDFSGKGIIQNQGGVLSLTIDLSTRKDGMKKKFIIKS